MNTDRPTRPATWKDSELLAFIQDRGLKAPEPFTRKEAIQLVAAAISDEVSGKTDMKETKTFIDELKEKNPKLEMMKVIFHSLGEQDLPYVFVGHNGASYYLPKEIEVEVPKYIMDSCIKDAVEDRLAPVTDRDGTVNWIKKKVQRFPYTIIHD